MQNHGGRGSCMTYQEFMTLFDDVCGLSVLRNGELLVVKAWTAPIARCKRVALDPDENGWARACAGLWNVTGEFRRGLPTTNLGDHLTSETVEIIATKADGRRARFQALVAMEDWEGVCIYRSMGPVEIIEADTPILVGA